MMKKTLGRRKIEIKKIAKKESRAVTFSKRHKGLFKKASELCVLTGAEIAVILQSSAGKVFAFGHPSPTLVIDRYLTDNGGSKPGTLAVCTENGTMQVQQYNQYYSQLCRELEAEKKKKEMMMMEELLKNNNDNGTGYWWDEAMDEENMGLEELEELMVALEELKKNVNLRADELTMINSSLIPAAANSSSNSTLTHHKFGSVDEEQLLNQAEFDFCDSSIVIPDCFDHFGDAHF